MVDLFDRRDNRGFRWCLAGKPGDNVMSGFNGHFTDIFHRTRFAIGNCMLFRREIGRNLLVKRLPLFHDLGIQTITRLRSNLFGMGMGISKCFLEGGNRYSGLVFQPFGFGEVGFMRQPSGFQNSSHPWQGDP